jgi:hypothetical protein
MRTDTSLDLSVLEQLDFPVPCGHSRHSGDPIRHGGAATHVAESYHKCPKRPGLEYPYRYPCCSDWARFVLTAIAHDGQIMCQLCGELGYWAEFLRIVGPL